MFRTGYRFFRIALCLVVPWGALNAGSLVVEQQGFQVPVATDLSPGVALDWPLIERFYQTQQHRFVWHEEEQLNQRGQILFDWLASSAQEGLNPQDYHVDRLRYLADSVQPGHRFLREILLTEGYFRLAMDLRRGRYDPQTVDPLWLLPANRFDPLDLLVTALQRDDLPGLLATLRPKSEAYRRLAEALNHYQAIRIYGGWRPLKGEQTLRPGDRHGDVAALRERLAAELRRPREPVADPQYFDQSLAASLRRYQRRLGLQDDGILGRETREALNVSVETRIAQIRANLERWRWLPNELESRYLLVNTAGFEIVLMDQGRAVFHRRTVNGRQERQTPSFVSQVTHLVFNPQWTVPRSIAVKDMLPKQQADRDYLRDKRIRVYERSGQAWREVDSSEIDWLQYHSENFPFVLRQDAGEGNSLGRIKFHMPNRHAIYLHDTPARGLFRRLNRAFSSGCVRVESADRLAHLLMQGQEVPLSLSVERFLSSEITRTASLTEPVPVYLAYFTSWVDESGQVHFRPDIYHRDMHLMLAMGEGMGRLTAGRVPGMESASL